MAPSHAAFVSSPRPVAHAGGGSCRTGTSEHVDGPSDCQRRLTSYRCVASAVRWSEMPDLEVRGAPRRLAMSGGASASAGVEPAGLGWTNSRRLFLAMPHQPLLNTGQAERVAWGCSAHYK